MYRRRMIRSAPVIAFLMSASISAPMSAQPDSRERQATSILEIPSEGPGYSFSVIGAIERLPDGRFAVLETVDRRVVVFDSTGKHVRSFGGNGDGPGEFRWPQSMGLRGDSLWVGDASHRRITTFSPALEIAGTQTISSPGIPSRTASGGAVVRNLLSLSRAPVAQSLTVITHSGSSIDTIVSVPYLASALVIEAGSMARLSAQPFSDAPLVHVSRDGRAVVVILRDTREGGSRAVQVRKVGLDGSRGFDIRLPYVPEDVARTLIDAEVTRIGNMVQQRIPSENRGEIDRRTRAALFIPPHSPAVTAVNTGQDGFTWLRRVSDGRSPVRWTVLDPTGKVVYEVRLPLDAEVLWSMGDLLAGTRKDADGVPRIVVYRIK